MPSALGNVQTGNTSLHALISHDKPQAELPNPRDGLVKGEHVITGNQGLAPKRIHYRRLKKKSSIRFDQLRKNKLCSTSNHRATWPMKFTCFSTALNGRRKKKILSDKATGQSMKYATIDHNQDATLYHNLQDVPPREGPFIKAPTPKDHNCQ